jgi:hypothetical protein
MGVTRRISERCVGLRWHFHTVDGRVAYPGFLFSFPNSSTVGRQPRVAGDPIRVLSRVRIRDC